MAIVINIIGEKSNVGKTRIMEQLIKELVQQGFSVGTIKHDVHGYDMDQPGKDTYIHREAGAESVIISSKERVTIQHTPKEEVPVEELIELLKDKDFILVEGYKHSSLMKVEVYRSGVSTQVISKEEYCLAILVDEFQPQINRKQIKINDIKEIVELLKIQVNSF